MVTSRRRSRPARHGPARQGLLARLSTAGREQSDAAVMFHAAVARKVGLSESEWKTLSLLERHGPLTAGELARHSGLSPPSVTGILNSLERRGWVRRQADPHDGRRVVVVLDQAAASVDMSSLFGGLVQRLDQLYERYSDEELELLTDLLTEIARRQREATSELHREESRNKRKSRR